MVQDAIGAKRAGGGSALGVLSCLGPLDAGSVGHGHLPSSLGYPEGIHRSADYGPVTTGLSPRLGGRRWRTALR